MLKYFIIISLLFMCAATADQAADKAEFKKLYAEFNELYANSEDIDPIIEVAVKLLDIAPLAYGKKSQNTAVVTYNLANLYAEKGGKTKNPTLNSKASDLFADYFSIINKNDAPKDRSYIFQYLQYIKAMASDGNNKSLSTHIKKLSKIATANNYTAAERADLEFKVGLYLFIDNNYFLALDYFKKSNELYKQALGAEHFKVGETSFWIAKIEMARNRRQAAENHFLTALNIFAKNKEAGHELSQSTHAFLVTLYEDMGQSDKATLHCQAVAEERPMGFDQFVSPLYRKSPTFPHLNFREFNNFKKKMVDVILQFEIDENGFTKNINVIESDSRKFNKNSILAAEKFRYAPSVKDGKIVATEDVRVRIRYVLQ